MKNLTQKFLMGLAVTSVGSLGHAAVLTEMGTTNSQYSSIEGNAAAASANAGAVVKLNTLKVQVAGSAYGAGDVVTVTFGAGTLRGASVGTVGGTTAGTDIITCTSAAPTNTGAVAGTQFKLNVTTIGERVVTYTVSDRTTNTLANDTVCTLPAFEMLTSSLTSATSVTFNWSAATAAGTVHDVLRSNDYNPALVKTVHLARTQFDARCSTSSGSFILGVCDSSLNPAATTSSSASTSTGVVPAGATFLEADGSTNRAGVTHFYRYSTNFSASLTSSAGLGTAFGAVQNLLTVAGSQITDTLTVPYTGDFSFIDNNGNGCSSFDLSNGWGQIAVTQATVSDANLVGAFAAPATAATISADCTTLTVTGPAQRIDKIEFKINQTNAADRSALMTGTASLYGAAGGNGAKAIAKQVYTGSAAFKLGTTTLASGTTFGSFDYYLGTSVEVNYMPYGSGISRIVYVTNRASVPATITISGARNEAGTSCASTSFPTVAIASQAIASVAAALDAGIAACFGSSYTGKVKFTLTVNNGSANSYGSFTNTATGLDAAAAATATIGVAASLTGGGTITRNKAKIEVISAYNVNGNRVPVLNSTNSL